MRILRLSLAWLSTMAVLVGCAPTKITKTRSYERTPQQARKVARDRLRKLVYSIPVTGELSSKDREFTVDRAKKGDLVESMMAFLTLSVACHSKLFEPSEAVSILEPRILASKDVEAFLFCSNYVRLLGIENRPNDALYIRVRTMVHSSYFSDETKNLVKVLKADPKSVIYAGQLLASKQMDPKQKQWALGEIAPLVKSATGAKRTYWESIQRVIETRDSVSGRL